MEDGVAFLSLPCEEGVGFCFLRKADRYLYLSAFFLDGKSVQFVNNKTFPHKSKIGLLYDGCFDIVLQGMFCGTKSIINCGYRLLKLGLTQRLMVQV